MYARRPNDRSRIHGVSIPANYSGNAFSSDGEPQTEQNIISEPEEEPISAEPEMTDIEVSGTQPKSEPIENGDGSASAGLLRLFGGNGGSSGGIGFEELLIIGLMLIVSQNDRKDDLSLLLLLLLFIK